jgi:gluconolactonase
MSAPIGGPPTHGAGLLDRFEDLADGLNHPEGVAWNPIDGHLYAGGEGGEFYRVSLDGRVEISGSSEGSLLGIAVDGDGRVYGCDAERGEVVRLDPSTGKVETYAVGVGGTRLDTPNVAAFGPDGHLYITCSGENGVPEIVRVPRSGVSERWSDTVTAYPNGCVVSPEGKDLLVVEAKAQRIARIPILADGSAGPAETFAELPDTDADGIAWDADDHVWATLYRPDGLVRIAPDGVVVASIDDHLATTFDAPTNLAFVGERLDRAVIANVGANHLSIGDLGVRGRRLHYPEVG